MVEVLGHEEILGKLALACYRDGGVRKWAKKHSCSHSTVSRILKGTYPITDGIAHILNIEAFPVFYHSSQIPPTTEEVKEWAKNLPEEDSFTKFDFSS